MSVRKVLIRGETGIQRLLGLTHYIHYCHHPADYVDDGSETGDVPPTSLLRRGGCRKTGPPTVLLRSGAAGDHPLVT